MSLRTSPQLDVDRADGAATALRSTVAVRERAAQLLQRARAGQSPWFVVHGPSVPAAVAEDRKSVV